MPDTLHDLPPQLKTSCRLAHSSKATLRLPTVTANGYPQRVLAKPRSRAFKTLI